jgi:hypothetical protein
MTVFLLTTSGTALRITIQYSQTGAPGAVVNFNFLSLLTTRLIFLSVLTTFAPDLSEFSGQN